MNIFIGTELTYWLKYRIEEIDVGIITDRSGQTQPIILQMKKFISPRNRIHDLPGHLYLF